MRPSVLALAALALGLVSACDKPAAPGGGGTAAPGSPAAAKVTLALNWVPEPEFGGFYAARASGAFARHALEVDIQGGGAGAPVVQRVATGQVDFGIVAADDVIVARARGADVVPLFATYQTSPHGILVHASRGAKTLADVFASGTVALEPGLPFASFLKKKYGFANVKIVPYDGGVARFVAEKDFAQQCFVTAEPIAAKKKGSDVQVFLVADEGFNPYNALVVTRRALMREKPGLAKRFVEAVREGWSSYLADPKPANEVMGKLNRAMDAETFAAAAEAQKPLIETAETKASGLGSMTRARWEALGKQLVELGIVEKAPSVDEVLVPVD